MARLISPAEKYFTQALVAETEIEQLRTERDRWEHIVLRLGKDVAAARVSADKLEAELKIAQQQIADLQGLVDMYEER